MLSEADLTHAVLDDATLSDTDLSKADCPSHRYAAAISAEPASKGANTDGVDIRSVQVDYSTLFDKDPHAMPAHERLGHDDTDRVQLLEDAPVSASSYFAADLQRMPCAVIENDADEGSIGTVDISRALDMSEGGLLIVGAPGTGKTSLIHRLYLAARDSVLDKDAVILDTTRGRRH